MNNYEQYSNSIRSMDNALDILNKTDFKSLSQAQREDIIFYIETEFSKVLSKVTSINEEYKSKIESMR
jgi:hypothetical protein